MTIPANDLGARHAVWASLSELYLDTDITPSLPGIARALTESEFSAAEIRAILFEEMNPILRANLSIVAGVWSGFDQEWLAERIVKATLNKWRNRHDNCLRADRGALTQLNWPSCKAAKQRAARRQVSPNQLILVNKGGIQKIRPSRRASRQGGRPSLRHAPQWANLLNAMTVVPLDQRCLKHMARPAWRRLPHWFLSGAARSIWLVLAPRNEHCRGESPCADGARNAW